MPQKLTFGVGSEDKHDVEIDRNLLRTSKISSVTRLFWKSMRLQTVHRYQQISKS